MCQQGRPALERVAVRDQWYPVTRAPDSIICSFLHIFRNKVAGVVSNEVPCSCEIMEQVAQASSNTPFFDMVASYATLCPTFSPRTSGVSFRLPSTPR